MNMTKSSLAQIMLALLIVGLTTPCSAVQETQPKESQPKAQSEPLGPGDHTRTLTVGGQERTYICPRPEGLRPEEAYAGGAGPARGSDERLDDGLVFRPEQEIGRSGLHRGLSQRHRHRAVLYLECRWLQGRWQKASRRCGLHRQAARRPRRSGQRGRKASLRLRHEQRRHDVLPAGRRVVRPDRRHRTRGRDHRH